MGRYETQHERVNTCFFPLPGFNTNRSTITDTVTGEKGEGFNKDSYTKADREAWQDLQDKIHDSSK
jgi:hypothetical protein